MKHLDLFSGIGGFALAAQWVWGDEHEIVSFVEIDEFCQKVLRKHWPNVPIHDDIGTHKHNGTKIDLVTGGFPCQPYSVAGKQRGSDDDRALWPEMLRVIREVQPTWIIGENVAGIIRMELDGVLSDLEAEGYSCQAFVIPACAVDAPHRRDRVWIVANAAWRGKESRAERWSFNKSGKTVDVADTDSNKRHRRGGAMQMGWSTRQAENKRDGTARFEWCPEPELGRSPYGFPVWLYRHIGRGLSYAESQRRTEILRNLWSKDVAEKIWRTVGGFDRVQKAEILFAFVRQHEDNPNQTRLFMESEKALEKFVRSMWLDGKITGASYRSKNRKQLSGKYTDSMQALSRLLAHDRKTNWQISNWEDGIARVSHNTSNRVDRLKSLGNAIVPQVVVPIMEAIKQIDA